VIKAQLWVQESGGKQVTHWGDYEFVAVPSPSQAIFIEHRGEEWFLTVSHITHLPVRAGVSLEPWIRVQANTLGSVPEMLSRVGS
jgi:hypothetical protein